MNKSRIDKQNEVYNFIKLQIKEKGYPPSVREICKAVGLSSTSSVHFHLKRLEKEGLIKRDSSKTRAIEIVDPTSKKEVINVPIVGTITAGNPILAIENIEDVFPLPIDYVKNTKDLFMLKVSGESMIEAGILNGDLAIIEKTDSANNGDIVVALIDNEATLKRFFKESSYIRLQPENKSMKPIILENCKVLGRLVGIYRKY
ncbi:transcriptional repressor LexA [Clostridium botulinum]|uniref:LexA repressor n=3 Tax=Clostridium botulinum TaxID=1491 RepID=LEXA_CLOBH|nr:transcriptional repressor LexA [Clostridium botulinum]A5I2R7.1 RecName: Full=LexA repressor [Clostridium botulinum A str. Hall]A7FUK4.1 RecName: Full=LexA repressor [Clostridium botulinum A str. ATCC 19397]ABS33610.1 LexA repressor [Clostridium botulinum A str. ATCC 19397]ABS37659.1 LexA repressor [Clostridium botulinum A str. Hall]APH19400.1 repressor LexA [Clostridium botulinum]APQ75486.1 repressor LexA [Clostridium botulinum]AUM91378.1 LexA repressor [Clostridium botulinum]